MFTCCLLCPRRIFIPRTKLWCHDVKRITCSFDYFNLKQEGNTQMNHNKRATPKWVTKSCDNRYDEVCGYIRYGQFIIQPILGKFWPWPLTLTFNQRHRHLGLWMHIYGLYLGTKYEHSIQRTTQIQKTTLVEVTTAPDNRWPCLSLRWRGSDWCHPTGFFKGIRCRSTQAPTP